MSRFAGVHSRHPIAAGVLAGTALGACLGLLFAPRRGSDTRKRLGDGVHHAVDRTSGGYRRAKSTVGHWANRGHEAYAATRDRVVKGAHGTSQYVREVADAVTMRAHRHAGSHGRASSSSGSSQ